MVLSPLVQLARVRPNNSVVVCLLVRCMMVSYDAWRLEQESTWDQLGITTKIVRENVFPLFFLLLLMLLALFIVRFAFKYMAACLTAVFHLLTCGKCSNMEGSVVKALVSELGDVGHDGGFTDVFHDPVSMPYVKRPSSMTDEQYWTAVELKLRTSLDRRDKKRGWRMLITEAEDGSISAAHLKMKWTSEGVSSVGLAHEKGVFLRTWEVMLETGGVYTYHPMANPAYTKLMVSMRQAQLRVEEAKVRIKSEREQDAERQHAAALVAGYVVVVVSCVLCEGAAAVVSLVLFLCLLCSCSFCCCWFWFWFWFRFWLWFCLLQQRAQVRAPDCVCSPVGKCACPLCRAQRLSP